MSNNCPECKTNELIAGGMVIVAGILLLILVGIFGHGCSRSKCRDAGVCPECYQPIVERTR